MGDLDPNLSAASLIRSVYCPMSAIMRRAAQDGLVQWSGLRRPKIDTSPRIRFLDPEEARRLIAAAEPYEFKALIIFLLYTGARLGEALGLKWADIDVETRHISLRQSKTKSVRPVSMGPEVSEMLNRLSHREDGYVFPWRDRTRVYKLWRPLCGRLGIEDFKMHDLRHTWATWARKYAGADLRQLMAAGGWKDYKSVIRYTHVTSDDVRSVFEELPRL